MPQSFILAFDNGFAPVKIFNAILSSFFSALRNFACHCEEYYDEAISRDCHTP
jgi:hypothetical protein